MAGRSALGSRNRSPQDLTPWAPRGTRPAATTVTKDKVDGKSVGAVKCAATKNPPVPTA
jgi:hypothetical protein